jgi:MarR family transcriptional regulator, organic hydroperoxide resistance regulator
LMAEARTATRGTHAIRQNTSFALAKVCRAHRTHVGELLAGHGLHVGQEMVLVELWQDDGLRGGDLADRLGVEPPTITRTLRRLESCGLVERRADPEDARSVRVYLTGQGQTLEEPVLRCWERAEQTVLAGMNASDRQTFQKLLDRVRSNLDPEFGARQ